jgi:hypothetical protein
LNKLKIAKPNLRLVWTFLNVSKGSDDHYRLRVRVTKRLGKNSPKFWKK